ncbi:hypothetical protein Tco_0183341 [Tanacetum coccineum]
MKLNLTREDFAKKMVKLVNQRKKHFAEERARAKRNKPMTQSQLRTYMMNYLKNHGTWKLSQLKNLCFEEVKEEFDKLVKQVESFALINFEATKTILNPISGTNIPVNPVLVAMKPPSISTYKIIKQGEKGVYQIVREDGTDIVYINFRAMLKDITRDDLTELYRIVMNRYGMNGPEDELEKVLWEYLKNMFEEPLSTDPIWSSLGQQRIISWRYYTTCRVHCLNLESSDIYMLTERKYPLTAERSKLELGSNGDEENLYADVLNCYRIGMSRFQEEDCADSKGLIEEVVTETMMEPTLGEYMEEVRANCGSNTTTPRFSENAKFKLGDEFLKILRDNAFNGTNGVT